MSELAVEVAIRLLWTAFVGWQLLELAVIARETPGIRGPEQRAIVDGRAG